MIYRLGEYAPNIHPDSFIAASADVIGRVEIGAAASIWFNCVLRGDNDVIRIGAAANVQDGSVIHVDPGFDVEVGDHATIGHRVTLHGCRVGSHTLVGINSVVLNGADIGPWCVVGANTMVTSGKRIPERSLVIGSPGKVVRTLTDEECQSLVDAARSYTDKVTRYRESLSPTGS